MNTINKNKAILTALMLIFLVGGNASAILGKFKKKLATKIESIGLEDTELHYAARKGDWKKIHSMSIKTDVMEDIEEEEDYEKHIENMVNKENDNNETPLDLVLSYNYYQNTKAEEAQRLMFYHLISSIKGVNIDFVSRNGSTALYRQVEKGNMRSAIMLLIAKADVNFINKATGKSILQAVLNAFADKKESRYYPTQLIMLLLHAGANRDNINLDRYKIEVDRKKQLFGDTNQSDEDFFNQSLDKHIKSKFNNITLEIFSRVLTLEFNATILFNSEKD